MPLEQIRILSILIGAASLAAFVVGDFGAVFLTIQGLAMAPLWFSIDLDAIRQHQVWRWYAHVTFSFFIASRFLGMPMRSSVFFLVLFCIIYEYYGEKRRKAPVRLLSLLSFLIVIYQSRFDNGINLFYGVLIYLTAVVYCFAAFHGVDLFKRRLAAFTRAQGGPLALHSAIIFGLGILVFWMIPRLPDQSLNALPDFSGERISGFSNTVTLNDIGSLKRSRKHVMDLKPLNGALHSRYLRGRALDYYQKGVWTNSTVYNYYPRSQKGRYRFARSPGERRFAYRIDTEALLGNPIFYFNQLADLEGRLEFLKMEGAMDHLSVMRAYPLAMSYTIYAYDRDPGAFRDFQFENCLQTPIRHEYIAEEALRALGPAADAAPMEQAQVLADYFKREFEYTLDVQNIGAQDPLRQFLRQKRGHCELFASVTALMLRSRGIPARLITGFLVPEPHPSGEFYYITESDAHAWVEYYADGAWRTIDPTPPATFVEPNFAEFQIAYIKHFWRNMVMSFDHDAQIKLWQDLRRGLTAFAAFALSRPLLWAFLVLAVGLAWFYFKVFPRLAKPERRLARCFRRLDDFLQRDFGPRGRDETLYDYVRRLGLPIAAETAVVGFLNRYHLLRFGKRGGQRQETNQALALGDMALKQLRAIHQGA